MVLASEVPFVSAQHTVASRLQLLVRAMRGACHVPQLMANWRTGLDLTDVGVAFPCVGFVMGCCPEARRRACMSLLNFGPVRNKASSSFCVGVKHVRQHESETLRGTPRPL